MVMATPPAIRNSTIAIAADRSSYDLGSVTDLRLSPASLLAMGKRLLAKFRTLNHRPVKHSRCWISAGRFIL